MAVKFKAETSGDHVKLFCEFDDGKDAVLGFIYPEEARRLAKYLEISAAKIEREAERSRK
jgi:hypothetical protein